MNPLPNRPLLNNAAPPLTLPNVPSFEQMAFNGRPRKVMPEAGKDFPMLNGIGLMSGPSTAPAAPGAPLERGNPMGNVMLQPPPSGQSQVQQHHGIGHSPSPQQLDKDKEADSEPQQLTAIFRPDDSGDWKEKLRISHEAQGRVDRLGPNLLSGSSSSWDRRREDDEDVKDEEPEVDDEDANIVGESDGNKIWKAKRTLRKSVAP
jgi:striatin 1/3/4